jgi:hypothetical protein
MMRKPAPEHGKCNGWQPGPWRDGLGLCRVCYLHANPATRLAITSANRKQSTRSSMPAADTPAHFGRVCLHLVADSQHRNERGHTIDPNGLAEDCDKRIARECRKHGTITTNVPYNGYVCCFERGNHCPDYATDERQYDAMIADLLGPERPRKREWVKNRRVQEAHRIAMRRYLESIPSYPFDREGRGVIICGGGPKYAIGIYVHIRMLRHLGSGLSVQVWHRGEAEPFPDCIRELAGVEVIDADAHPLRSTWRTYGGWQMKLIAGLNSGWRRWIFSDADNYPVLNPEICFDKNPTGAILWPDIASNDGGVKWKSYGVSPPANNIGTNAGSAVFDLAKCWKALNLAHWFDMHSEYYYQVQYGVGGFGDQDQVRAAFVVAEAPYQLYNQRPENRGGIFLQNGPDGRVMFAHRIHDKRFDRRDDTIPMESLAHEFAAEYRKLTGEVPT